jgi:hypothetical protein
VNRIPEIINKTQTAVNRTHATGAIVEKLFIVVVFDYSTKKSRVCRRGLVK